MAVGDEETLDQSRTPERRIPTVRLYEEMDAYRDFAITAEAKLRERTPEEKVQIKRDFTLVSLAMGLPVAVRPEGSLVTPLDVWDQIRKKYDLTPDTEITTGMLIGFGAVIGVNYTAVNESNLIQDWAKEMLSNAREVAEIVKKQ